MVYFSFSIFLQIIKALVQTTNAKSTLATSVRNSSNYATLSAVNKNATKSIRLSSYAASAYNKVQFEANAKEESPISKINEIIN